MVHNYFYPMRLHKRQIHVNLPDDRAALPSMPGGNCVFIVNAVVLLLFPCSSTISCKKITQQIPATRPCADSHVAHAPKTGTILMVNDQHSAVPWCQSALST